MTTQAELFKGIAASTEELRLKVKECRESAETPKELSERLGRLEVYLRLAHNEAVRAAEEKEQA